jgi:succinyl-diaminopimelate desuccinylase
MLDLTRFVDKYQLALETAAENKPQGGLFGLELEWNLLDHEFHPLSTVHSGTGQASFVDHLRSHCLSPWLREFSQLEVFNWMVEWATRPYYQAHGAVFEARLMEGALVNALDHAGRQLAETLYYWHGNLPILAKVEHASIPGSWHLAKRRYLERCVDLYGDSLATAGTHTNLSLPDPLFAWDFMHLSPTERGDIHLDDYKSQFYITATRLLRAFTALFIATSASTPLQAGLVGDQPVVFLTATDSVRNLTFPNPPALDVPNLYRSYNDYLSLSYDLVRRGIRFGNNNWTPVRARSFAEPVERLIAVTSEQLQDIYSRGIYTWDRNGNGTPPEEMVRQIEIQNLMARINLPMARVEVRTDDGSHSLEVDVANLLLKHLLLLRFYADPTFGRAFRYDAEDITRARLNEEKASRHGLRAEIEHPLTGKPVEMRPFLHWTLNEVRPLAEALGYWTHLQPLQEMAGGGPNAAELLRKRIIGDLQFKELSKTERDCFAKERLAMTMEGGSARTNEEGPIVPIELLRQIAEERVIQVQRDIESLVRKDSPAKEVKLHEFIQHAQDSVRINPLAPIRFRSRPETQVELPFPDKTSEILAVAQALIRIPSVTACPNERLEEVHQAATFIYDYFHNHGVEVRLFDRHKYPALLASFTGEMKAPVMLCGHFDVVSPEPDDSQFTPRIDGEYLWGRGAADMKTVVATFMVWLKDTFRSGSPYPSVNLLLVGNEENGEVEPAGTPHVLKWLAEESGYQPQLLVTGERTGDKGSELWGEICIQNRGVIRGEIRACGTRGHSGTSAPSPDLTDRLFQARLVIQDMLNRHLTLSSPDGWQSQARFPYIQVGTPGIYNITADTGILGIEVRPIPQDDLSALRSEMEAYCKNHELILELSVFEPGIACDPQNLSLIALLQAVHQVSAQKPVIGRKLPGTSARFAPAGQGVVWGQSGLAPHAANECHFIPSILPYYRALQALGQINHSHGDTHA